MNPWIIVGALIAIIAVAVFSFSKGDSIGYARAVMENQKAIKDRDKKIEELVLEDEKKVRAFANQVHTVRSQANEKISKLLSENATLREVWNLALPADIADYAWGLPNSVDDRPVPR